MKELAQVLLALAGTLFVYLGAMAADNGQEIFGICMSVSGLLGFVFIILMDQNERSF